MAFFGRLQSKARLTPMTTVVSRTDPFLKSLSSASPLLSTDFDSKRYSNHNKNTKRTYTNNRQWSRGKTLAERKSLLREKAEAKDTKPSKAVANAMPISMSEMDNATLVTMGGLGVYEAIKEMLKRHIMVVDDVTYDEACILYEKVEKENRKSMYLLALPYQFGIALGATAAFASIPLVFDHSTAVWFNEHFVTTDVPEPKDLETMLEVGSWTWNWMEPPLGQISFFLLCLQFCRAQIDNLGIKPYTSKIKQMRGVRLAEIFPQYDSRLLIKYSESASIYKRYF